MKNDVISISVRSQNARAVPAAHVCERYVLCRCVRVFVRRDLCLQRGDEAGERTHSRLYRAKLSFPGGFRGAISFMVFS